ncbi:MAG: glutathione S-transferase family protein [bacterium]|nr:glutathione S-transferase family protein [bacterium]
MSQPIVFGAAYSVYVRTVRLTLAEKNVPYRLVEVDVFSEGGPPPDYLLRHPFGRIPAFEHDGFQIYETDAIVRYIDETFDGPSLIPDTPRSRARMTQAMRILDCYAYPSMVWGVYVEQVDAPQEGRETNSVRLDEAIGRSRTCLRALERLMDGGPFLFGYTPCLADLHAVPMFAYFRLAPKGRQLLDEQPRLKSWLEHMLARPSIAEIDDAGS